MQVELLQVLSTDYHLQHYLGAWYKCTFLVLPHTYYIGTSVGGAQESVFDKPSKSF